jgi:hypothetical protein
MNNKTIKYIIIVICLLLIVAGGLYLTGVFSDGELRSRPGEFILRIEKNGASSIDNNELSCKIVDGKCNVTLPMATRKDGEVLGYSFNKDNSVAEYKVGDTVTLTENKRIYVISYKKLSMNVVTDSIDYIATPDVSCNAYNKEDSCEVIPGPFNKEGYEVRGYSTSEKSQAGYIWPNTAFELEENLTVYPIWNTYTRGRGINVSNSFTQGSMTFDVEEGCPVSIYDDYLDYFKTIEERASYLVIGTKVTFLTDKTFDEIWGSQYVGMNYGPTDLRMMDVRCSTGNNYYATIVHEMGHTWDFHYKSVLGKEISKQNDIINTFNKYKEMSSRPFRDYSYSDIREFFADMVRYYYLKYTDPIYEYSSKIYPDDIKGNLEKYICITNNKYKEDKCR